MKGMNWLGMYTLYLKEVHRYLKVYNQTLFAPVVTAMLFLAVFSLAVGRHVESVGTIPFIEFMAAGLIMMSVVQNAFANTSSSFTMGKVLGTLVDYLMPPLSAFEIMCGMIGAAVTRGIMVGILVSAAICIFHPLTLSHPLAAIYFLISASFFLATIGVLTGIFADSFDQMAAITSYIITPLSFLSGTFYSVHQLPVFWYHVSQFNPFFYMIDGFRYGLTGYTDGNVILGAVYLLALNILLWISTSILLARGYRVKS